MKKEKSPKNKTGWAWYNRKKWIQHNNKAENHKWLFGHLTRNN